MVCYDSGGEFQEWLEKIGVREGLIPVGGVLPTEALTEVGGKLGVEGVLGSRRLRFQNPALGPFIIKDNVHRESPRNDSGR